MGVFNNISRIILTERINLFYTEDYKSSGGGGGGGGCESLLTLNAIPSHSHCISLSPQHTLIYCNGQEKSTVSTVSTG